MPANTNDEAAGDAAAETIPRAARSPRLAHRVRVRSLLVAVALIPTLAMVVVSAASAQESWHRRQTSATVERDAQRLEALIVTRALLTHEEVNSLVLLIGGELGATPERLTELYGTDFEQELSNARAAVDGDPTFQLDPVFEDERQDLRALRASVDDRTTTSDGASQSFVQLGADIDEVWAEQFGRLDSTLVAASLPGEFGMRLEDVEHAHAAFLAGLRRTKAAIDVMGGETSPATTRRVLEADTNFRMRAAELDRSLGTFGSDAWRAFEEDPASVGFERTTEQAVDAALTGVPDPAWRDPTAYGNALFGGVGWSNALTAVVGGASADLSAIAAKQQVGAVRDFQVGVGFAVLLTVLSLLAATIVARSVSRPLNELALKARSVREGRLEIDPVQPRGPRELAETAAAFNEMVVALTAVEARAVAMADDPEDVQSSVPIPGRTGEALDRAFGLLRASIRSADASRAALHELATHDGMTGLLNRTAAIAALERDLEGAHRHGRSVAVVYLDVDGLKAVNDRHGHDAGDELIILMANTLRASTRASDLVARLGGDEFLVAGLVDDVSSTDAEHRLEPLTERLRRAIDDASMQVGDVRVQLRASLGVAVSEPGEVTADGIVRRADAAMYRAKHAAAPAAVARGSDGAERRPRRDRSSSRSVREVGRDPEAGGRRADSAEPDQTVASSSSAMVSACSSRPPNSGSRA